CFFRFTMDDRVVCAPLLLVKMHGTREPFSRNKILHVVMAAGQKRPISSQQFEPVGDRVENTIRKQGVSEISSKKIGQYVMDDLANLDDVAYIRFASIYREFKDMSSFMKTMEDMMAKKGKGN
ncbi:ATP cone domain-containing protein, partial [Lactobacillus crispatus]|uniref:ATP cone domain-containing protein n=1 Tax=Lactobacillus crispatus TaxID=47770 RepID=UPI001F096FF3